MEIPTLLIGLGGIGSYVVEQVYKQVPIENRTKLAVHAFDTNINDISKRQTFLKDKMTQTSIDWTVGQYLNQADDSVKNWFPFENKLIHSKRLTDGAGEIRSVSRLAYRAAMGQNKLNKLHDQIRKMFLTERRVNDGLFLGISRERKIDRGMRKGEKEC